MAQIPRQEAEHVFSQYVAQSVIGDLGLRWQSGDGTGQRGTDDRHVELNATTVDRRCKLF